MKIKIKIYTYILGIITLTLCACEDEIDVNLRTADPQLVIEGKITPDSFAEVRLSKTKSFSGDNDYPLVTDAVVTLSDQSGSVEQLQLNEEGYYISQSIKGKERTTYSLVVEYEGKEYTSSSRMPPVVKIDSLSLLDFPVLDYPLPRAHFKDPKGEENNYYRFVVYINGVRPDIGLSLCSAEFMDGLAIVQYLSVFSDDDDDLIEQGDEITVEMHCIDKDVYKFWEDLNSINNSLTNPTSNIRGGALGYFSAYSFDVSSIIAEW